MNIDDIQTSEQLLNRELFTELFSIEDEVSRTFLTIDLADKAKEFGVKTKFDELVKAFTRAKKEEDIKNRATEVSNLESFTNFKGDYPRFFCGNWIANEQGIVDSMSSNGNAKACYHPILIVERMKNLETGDEKVKLAFKRNKVWREIIVDNDIIASSSKIVSLRRQGINVNSENAKLLVRYLSELEAYNEHDIPVRMSTGKLGWIGDKFMPYDDDIIFDSNSRFKDIYESVSTAGSFDTWLETMREIRRSGRLEPKMMMAAAFASVLIGLLDALPFFTHLWGMTEGGKTVCLMIAASIYANPAESRYIGDFKTTDVQMEARNDFLNNLPLILDDTSQMSSRIRDNFEGMVYDLCSGKGKSRSNKELGITQEKRWSNTILTTGEHPLANDQHQGGAINRILDLECAEKAIFDDAPRVVEVVKNNYGHAGKLFVEAVKKLGKSTIKAIQKDILSQIYEDDKMQKQSASLSILLTADKIATEYIFKDGLYIDYEEASKVLVSRNQLSDNERCYQYILGEVTINGAKFDLKNPNAERWGAIENGYAIIYTNVFDRICKTGGFSRKAFLSWADKRGLLRTQSGKLSKVKRFDGEIKRCIHLKMDDEPENETDSEGFEVVYEQTDIPF